MLPLKHMPGSSVVTESQHHQMVSLRFTWGYLLLNLLLGTCVLLHLSRKGIGDPGFLMPPNLVPYVHRISNTYGKISNERSLQNSVVIHCLYMVIVKYAMYYHNGAIKTTEKHTAENDKNAQCLIY